MTLQPSPLLHPFQGRRNLLTVVIIEVKRGSRLPPPLNPPDFKTFTASCRSNVFSASSGLTASGLVPVGWGRAEGFPFPCRHHWAQQLCSDWNCFLFNSPVVLHFPVFLNLGQSCFLVPTVLILYCTWAEMVLSIEQVPQVPLQSERMRGQAFFKFQSFLYCLDWGILSQLLINVF